MSEDYDQIKKNEETAKQKDEITALLSKATPEQIERLYYFITKFIK